jgi:hypothetical protein
MVLLGLGLGLVKLSKFTEAHETALEQSPTPTSLDAPRVLLFHRAFLMQLNISYKKKGISGVWGGEGKQAVSSCN